MQVLPLRRGERRVEIGWVRVASVAAAGRCRVARELAMSLVEWLRARAALRSAPNARARSQKAASIVERRPGHLSAAATASQHKGSQMAFFRVFRVFRGLTNKKICANLR